MILGSSSGAVPIPNKNNISVAFSGGVTPCEEATYTNTTGDARRTLDTSRWGQAFEPESGNTIFEKIIKKVTVELDNDSKNPDETITMRVRNSSGAIVATIGEMDASELTGSYEEYTFPSTGSVSIQLSAGDMITIEYPITSGDAVSVNVLNGSVSNSDSLTASNPSLTNWTGGWDHTTQMKIVYCE